MSKSAENDASRINLTDDAAAIVSKVKRCKTDSFEGLEFDNPDRPEAAILLTLYQLATGKSKVWECTHRVSCAAAYHQRDHYCKQCTGH